MAAPLESLEAFIDVMKKAREQGRITPEKPLTARKICETLNAKWGWKITDVRVREWVNEARKRRIPISSTGAGYFYATSYKDLEVADAHLSSRLKAIHEAREGVRAQMQHMKNEEERITGGELFKKLDNEFGPLERVAEGAA